MIKSIAFQRKVLKEEEGQYLCVPFPVPQNVDIMEISYRYEKDGNIIDFGLMDEKDEFIGWSGSDRGEITLSQRMPSPGFAPSSVQSGAWNVLLGAYQVRPEGVLVSYEVSFKEKEIRLLKGDTHVHSCGSDGNMTTEELAFLAEKEELDYLFITDHNNYAHNFELHSTPGVTMIPGVEWTHYKGHAGMLGVKRPFKSFISNSREETVKRLTDAKEAGALVVLNHPFCPNCGWRWGMEEVPYDLIEIWNGALMTDSNLACLNWWDARLKEGKRIPVIGGSDFHKIEPGRMPASPCTYVYARSRSGADILEAIRKGNSFVTISPDGPGMDARAEGERLPGDEVSEGTKIDFKFWNLKEGDRICLVREDGVEEMTCENNQKTFSFTRAMPAGNYYRTEIYRTLLHGIAPMPVLISNPFYIAGEKDVK